MSEQDAVESRLLNQLGEIVDDVLASDSLNGIAKSSFESVKGRLERGAVDEEMFKQGVKYLKKSARGDDDEARLKQLNAWKKAWGNRPLDDEDLASEVLERAFRALAAGESTKEIEAIREGAVSKVADYNKYSFFDSRENARALVVCKEKGLVQVEGVAGDLVDRLYKLFTKRLTKELGKPKGSAKNKEFKKGRAVVSLAFQKMPGNDPFPRDTYAIRFNARGGAVEIFGS